MKATKGSTKKEKDGMKRKLPKGCVYPNCFNCPLPDCLLPDDEDLLKDGEAVVKIDELKEKRRVIMNELHSKGLKTCQSAEYKRISKQIYELENRDLRKLKRAERYKLKHP